MGQASRPRPAPLPLAPERPGFARPQGRTSHAAPAPSVYRPASILYSAGAHPTTMSRPTPCGRPIPRSTAAPRLPPAGAPDRSFGGRIAPARGPAPSHAPAPEPEGGCHEERRRHGGGGLRHGAAGFPVPERAPAQAACRRHAACGSAGAAESLNRPAIQPPRGSNRAWPKKARRLFGDAGLKIAHRGSCLLGVRGFESRLPHAHPPPRPPRPAGNASGIARRGEGASCQKRGARSAASGKPPHGGHASSKNCP